MGESLFSWITTNHERVDILGFGMMQKFLPSTFLPLVMRLRTEYQFETSFRILAIPHPPAVP